MEVVQIDSTQIPTVDSPNKDKVLFTKRQYDYLNKVFAEHAGSPTTTDAQLRWNSGVRAVIAHIKMLSDVR